LALTAFKALTDVRKRARTFAPIRLMRRSSLVAVVLDETLRNVQEAKACDAHYRIRHTPIGATRRDRDGQPPRAPAWTICIYQAGGCCDGSLPLCLLADELGRGSNDVLLGSVQGVPFYIDVEQYERWCELWSVSQVRDV
jgi:Protein of unknown function (DUF779)